MGDSGKRSYAALASAILFGAAVMYLVSRQFMVTAWVAAVPAGALTGLVTGWLRPSGEPWQRVVTALLCSAVTTVMVAVLATPWAPGYVVRLTLGWLVVLVELTLIHSLVAILVGVLRGVTRPGRSVSRLR